MNLPAVFGTLVRSRVEPVHKATRLNLRRRRRECSSRMRNDSKSGAKIANKRSSANMATSKHLLCIFDSSALLIPRVVRASGIFLSDEFDVLRRAAQGAKLRFSRSSKNFVNVRARRRDSPDLFERTRSARDLFLGLDALATTSCENPWRAPPASPRSWWSRRPRDGVDEELSILIVLAPSPSARQPLWPTPTCRCGDMREGERSREAHSPRQRARAEIIELVRSVTSTTICRAETRAAATVLRSV